jgi:antitoxin component of RelBE/YafQ-DinJ toxin-antitoxin module
MTPLTTKVPPEVREQFSELAVSLGATPSSALRMLTYAFIKAGGFPYEMRAVEPAREASVIQVNPKSFMSALKNMQDAMVGEAEEAGIRTDEDVIALVREVR